MRWLREEGLAGRAGRWLRDRPALLRHALERLTIRTVLFLGFGLIFGLWLISGFDLVRRLAEVESRASAINARFTKSEELLSTVRAQVLLGAVYVRDALLDIGFEEANSYRERLQATRTEIDQALQEYVPVMELPVERENWAVLQSEIEDYWNVVLPVLSWDPTRKFFEARTFLRREVIPKRDIIISISERIQVLNRDALQRQQQELALVYREIQHKMWWTSGLALLLGLGIAFLVTHYAGRLEGRILQQHLQDIENRRELQRLSAQLVRAQEEERRSIARELHDEIGQALTAIKMELAVAERHLERSGKGGMPLREARSIADRTLHAVRDLSQLLHPTMLDDLGLPDTLNWYLRGFSKRTGIRAELIAHRMEERLAPEVEVCAYRIIQEAMTNVTRHAKASLCRLYLQRLPYTLLITVEDNGKGFDPRRLKTPNPRRGLGLVGIRERASGLGGTFRLESSPGKGARLSVELPALPAPISREEPVAVEVPASPNAVPADTD